MSTCMLFLIRKKNVHVSFVRPTDPNLTLGAKMSQFCERDHSALQFLISVRVFSGGLEATRIRIR